MTASHFNGLDDMASNLSSELRESTEKAGGARAGLSSDGAGCRKIRNPKEAPLECAAAGNIRPSATAPRVSGRAQGVFKDGSRRREEADFGASNASASLPPPSAVLLRRTGRRPRLLRRFLNPPCPASSVRENKPCAIKYGLIHCQHLATGTKNLRVRCKISARWFVGPPVAFFLLAGGQSRTSTVP
jgi:hypothetical protein